MFYQHSAVISLWNADLFIRSVLQQNEERVWLMAIEKNVTKKSNYYTSYKLFLKIIVYFSCEFSATVCLQST